MQISIKGVQMGCLKSVAQEYLKYRECLLPLTKDTSSKQGVKGILGVGSCLRRFIDLDPPNFKY